jgi:hypothetical protein
MANAQRRKGLRGEAEVAAIWRERHYSVHGLEGRGDLSVVRRVMAYENGRQAGWENRIVLHVEVKRQNRLRTEWIAQAKREAPAGAVPVVAWRPDGGKWWAMIPLEDLARLLA